MNMRQFHLQHENCKTVCWLEDKNNIKLGMRVTLKGNDERKWTICGISDFVKKKSEIKSTWNVGGVNEARR